MVLKFTDFRLLNGLVKPYFYTLEKLQWWKYFKNKLKLIAKKKLFAKKDQLKVNKTFFTHLIWSFWPF